MAQLVHGGDIYSAREKGLTQILDFSANINPLGMSKEVRDAACRALEACEHYPDPLCRRLCGAIAEKKGIDPSWVLCGNGAADVIFRLVLALKPRRTLLPAPTFAEYEQALRSVGCQVDYLVLRREEHFRLTPRIVQRLREGEGYDIVFVCNPNNPTGQLTPRGLLLDLLAACEETGCLLAVDECFLDFADPQVAVSLTSQLQTSRSLFILQAFTKMYAMAGLRLGYGLCSDVELLDRIAQCGQPWSVSIPAQAAGLAALELTEIPRLTREFLAAERPRLTKGLRRLGFWVAEPSANYIFFQAPGWESLRQDLEEDGVLIRSCANYRGLGSDYYRIAVRSHEENTEFLGILNRCHERRCVRG